MMKFCFYGIIFKLVWMQMNIVDSHKITINAPLTAHKITINKIFYCNAPMHNITDCIS